LPLNQFMLHFGAFCAWYEDIKGTTIFQNAWGGKSLRVGGIGSGHSFKDLLAPTPLQKKLFFTDGEGRGDGVSLVSLRHQTPAVVAAPFVDQEPRSASVSSCHSSINHHFRFDGHRLRKTALQMHHLIRQNKKELKHSLLKLLKWFDMELCVLCLGRGSPYSGRRDILTVPALTLSKSQTSINPQ